MAKTKFTRTTGRRGNKTDILLIILILLTIMGVLSDLIVLKEGWKSIFGWLF